MIAPVRIPGRLRRHAQPATARASGDSTGGQSEYVGHLARAAVACGVDGLFMEVHDNPPMALSDAATQFALDKLEPLLETLLKIHQLAQPKNRRFEVKFGYSRSKCDCLEINSPAQMYLKED